MVGNPQTSGEGFPVGIPGLRTPEHRQCPSPSPCPQALGPDPSGPRPWPKPRATCLYRTKLTRDTLSSPTPGTEGEPEGALHAHHPTMGPSPPQASVSMHVHPALPHSAGGPWETVPMDVPIDPQTTGPQEGDLRWGWTQGDRLYCPGLRGVTVQMVSTGWGREGLARAGRASPGAFPGWSKVTCA